ncbi:MAG: SLC13 family permease [Planctomycetota bacterium]|nr:SLC13 family permease [Planctomycetota bacterium]MEE3296586.1 SLC13 family permease [Planctomycetota bacterium]|tara:strand:- start:91 stop:1521 length:1431 start_codon:yes stop_codon:yes gene_type:complete
MSPFLILLIGVLFIVAAIIWLKLHPFFALILAAVLVGLLPSTAVEVAPGVSVWEQALRSFENSAAGLGLMAGKIGIVIALAAVIGQCLMESGAADRITRTLLNIFGEKRANWALLLSGYCLSIPVFFDTVFFLLVPLARAMFLRTGKNYMGYVMAICAGGVITHGIVPPTPGPLLMAETLNIELGQAILGGFLIGLPVALFGGLVLPRLFVSRGLDLPMRDTPGASTADLQEIVDRSEKELPGFFVSILPVALPVILITAHSVWKALGNESDVLALLGNKNLAMFIATGVAMTLLARSKGYNLKQLTTAIEPALREAGVIILITAAGGAFGGMLKETGIGKTISDMVTGYVDGGEATGGLGVLLIFIAWGSAAVMKVAQGSGTVAVITAAGIMAGVLAGLDEAGVALPYHKIYIFAAISFGAKVISWMNDSGYWVVCKMSGFTEKETLKTWTAQLAAMGIFGLIEVLVLIHLFPLK